MLALHTCLRFRHAHSPCPQVHRSRAENLSLRFAALLMHATARILNVHRASVFNISRDDTKSSDKRDYFEKHPPLLTAHS